MPTQHAARRRHPGAATHSATVARVLIGVLVAGVVGVSATVALVALGVVAAPAGRLPAPAAEAADETGAAAPGVAGASRDRDKARAQRVLAAWDARRARAWRSGDVEALRGLYVRGSRAGVRDAAMLTQWSRRGLRVRTLEMSLEEVWVLAATRRELHLVVRDRVARVVAEPVTRSAGTGATPASYALPRDTPTVRSLELRREPEGWRMARVRLR